METYKNHFIESTIIQAPPEEVFKYIDDHEKYYSHVMSFSKILGGNMNLEMDEQRGQAVGSRIRLAGKVFGKSLELEEVITKRQPPNTKVWETIGTPQFLIVGQYMYSVQIEPHNEGSTLTITFDSNPPLGSSLIRRLFSDFYSKQCAREMVKFVRTQFKNKGN